MQEVQHPRKRRPQGHGRRCHLRAGEISVGALGQHLDPALASLTVLFQLPSLWHSALSA